MWGRYLDKCVGRWQCIAHRRYDLKVVEGVWEARGMRGGRAPTNDVRGSIASLCQHARRRPPGSSAPHSARELNPAASGYVTCLWCPCTHVWAPMCGLSFRTRNSPSLKTSLRWGDSCPAAEATAPISRCSSDGRIDSVYSNIIYR